MLQRLSQHNEETNQKKKTIQTVQKKKEKDTVRKKALIITVQSYLQMQWQLFLDMQIN